MQALKQWYETMIPALFPMMLMSSILVDIRFAEKIGKLLNHTLLRFLHISDSGCYCLVTGFLFGFPMGAKTTADMLSQNKINHEEAEYLVSFINCLGPMYILNLIQNRFPSHNIAALFLGVYGLPLIYGLILRYTIYREEKFHQHKNAIKTINSSLSDAIYECVPKCGRSILMLGGYMVLFQVSFITLEHFLHSINVVSNAYYPLLEITGGLFLLPADIPLPWLLFYLVFGGACCTLQTYSLLKPAGLSIRKYLYHKIILAAASFLLGILL